MMLLKPAATAYAADQLSDFQGAVPNQVEAQDKLTWDCQAVSVLILMAFALLLTCSLTNTTGGTTGHDVVVSASESTGNLEISPMPDFIPQTPYNEIFEIVFELYAPKGTPPGKYTVELTAKGYDTNLATQILEVEVALPTATNTLTSTTTPTQTYTVTPTMTTTSSPTSSATSTPSITVQPEEMLSVETAEQKQPLISLPWWVWTFFGISALFLTGFTLWLLFFRKDAQILGCWWLLFGISGLNFFITMGYLISALALPWGIWIFFGISSLYVVGFLVWMLFFKGDRLIPLWLWILFGIASLMILGTLGYLLCVLFC